VSLRATSSAFVSDGTAAAPPIIELRDAAVQVGGRTVWSEAALEVERGEFVAVLGPNGAGKSTLLRALLGLISMSAGSISILGGAPGEHNAAIGYVPQRHGFDAGTRIRGVDLVRLGLDGDRWGLPLRARRVAAARVEEVLALVGAGAYAWRAIGECSGGEQQRLLVAQALVSSPELLLLDEPLDSLDLPNQAAISALLARICSSERVATLLVAHDVNPLLGHVDRVVYVAAGRIVAGTPEQVITSETLSALYGVPVEVLRTSDGRLVVVGQPEAPAHHHDRHEH
jgi:zinc/manganese transport system ATP-binding protein